jgi:hypothetical protein
MFVGHYAVAFASKKYVPQVSLGILFAAAALIDLLWPVLLLLGIEHAEIEVGNTATTPIAFTDYPISHSLLMVAVWSLLIAFLYSKFTRDKVGARWVGALVLSHWLLDFIVHRADLPLYPSGPELGLGLWNLKWVTLVIELAMFVVGFAMYKRVTHAKIPFGRFGIWFLFLLLIVLQFANFFGPPPPNIHAVAVAGNLQWLFVIFAFFVDKHRRLTDNKMARGSIAAAT